MAAREASLARGVRGHVWAPQTTIRRFDSLARCVARRLSVPTKQMDSYHRSRRAARLAESVS